MEKKNGMLYPMMVIAAISVILFSIVGIATMTGFIPSAQSQRNDSFSTADATKRESASSSSELIAPKDVSLETATGKKEIAREQVDKQVPAICHSCGVVESVNAHEVKGQGSALGVVSGAVLGGIVGHQVGSGRGNDLATVAGAVGGGFAGHEVERNIKKTTQYRVRVHMDDDTYRTFTLNRPTVSVGEKVRVKNGTLLSQN